ncbi:MAG TPA: penicillin-binding protein 2 [Rudaea sp.]|jgi:penicillin-binding protein 2|uniref:penicillin-binding protein 2 n=1 Tax=Rudaea sp. TaxID=2136325 RepID=UPI002F94B713
MNTPIPSARIKDARHEAGLFSRRALIGFLGIVACLGLLVARFVFLQVLHDKDFAARSDANRISVRGIAPSRGLIYDRNGVLLADNAAAFRLEVVPEQVKDMNAMLADLGSVIAISDDDIARFNSARRNKKPFDSVPLRLKLSEDEIARFSVDRWRFPAVDVVPYLSRTYPLGAAFTPVVGYVSRIDVNEAARLDADLYVGTTHIGKTGIERYYEDELHGMPGYEKVEVNADKRVQRQIERVAPTPGKNLYLSIDARLQRVAEDAFNGRSGAAVAIDPRNGEVLAMVSVPSFDGNLFVNGISQIDYSRLMSDPAKPLLNRAIAGSFLPGSTMKPYVAVAGLELGLRKPSDTVISTGEFHIPGQARGYRDDFPAGRVDMATAITESVNTYFYTLALEMGIDRFSDFLGRFGFGEKTGIDLAGEGVGVLPSRAWKRATQNQTWYPGETVIAGIGQGAWVVTPIQLVTALSTIASKGERLPPHLLRAVQAGLNTPPEPAPAPLSRGSIFHNPVTWPTVEQGMVGVVNSPNGTAHGLGDGFPYVIAGKTGTAERYSRTDETWTSIATSSAERHQVLFECFTPADNARVAVVVALEAGHSGASDAAPIARKILDAWLAFDDDARRVAGAKP